MNMGCARFALGMVVSTPAALEVLRAAGQDVVPYLVRHSRGDWGELCEEDKHQNEMAVAHESRLLSCYTLPTQDQIWIITEADRSVTTVLLPEDY